jgi:tetratricopeptide (TPR) repeat protein
MPLKTDENGMEMRRQIIVALVLIGSSLACLFVWFREHQGGVSSSANISEHARGHEALPALPINGLPTKNRKSGRETPRPIIVSAPNGEKAAFLQRAWAKSDPRARHLFEDGLHKTRDGRFTEAREAFQELIHSFPDDKAISLASWAMGLAYYKEGGRENFRRAADAFKEFDRGYDYETDLEELHQPALIDVALIELDLMKSATPEMLLSDGTAQRVGSATLGLKAFLKRWPDSPYAPAVHAALQEIMWSTSPH